MEFLSCFIKGTQGYFGGIPMGSVQRSGCDLFGEMDFLSTSSLSLYKSVVNWRRQNLTDTEKKKQKQKKGNHRSVKELLVAQIIKNEPTVWETWVQSLGWEDPLEKEMATHSSILA